MKQPATYYHVKGCGYVERQEIAVAEKKPLSWFTEANADVA